MRSPGNYILLLTYESLSSGLSIPIKQDITLYIIIQI